MRLSKASNLITLCLLGLLTAVSLSAVLTYRLAEQRRDTVHLLHRQSDALNAFGLGHDGLIEYAVAYLVTGRKALLEDFEIEKNSTRTRDYALDRLIRDGLSAKETEFLQEGKRLSDALLDRFRQAFVLAEQGRRAAALDMAYADAVRNDHQRFKEVLRLATGSMHRRLDDRVARLDLEVNAAMAVTAIALAVSLLVILASLLGFYRARMLKPLGEFTAKAQRMTRGERDIEFGYASADNEIGDLARALQNYQEAMVEIERQRSRFELAELWYHHILEFSPDAMLVANADGKIVMANPKAHELFAYPPGELIGVDVDLLVPDEMRGRQRKMREAFVDRGTSFAMHDRVGEFRAQDRNGRIFAVDVGLTRMPPLENWGVCVCAVLRDISRRKAAEKVMAERLEFQRVLLDTLPYPVFFKDREQRYLGFNRAFGTVFNVKAEDMVGHTADEFQVLSDDLKRRTFETNQQLLQDGGIVVREMSLPFADGKTHEVIYTLASFNDAEGKVAGLIGSLIDISPQKESERALAAAREIAEEGARLKSDFLANMSHEIRTPMNVIIGMAHLALETALDSRQRNYIGKAHAAAQNLLGIINDILDFSKIEAGRMLFESTPFYLEDVLENLADLASTRAREKGLELLFDVAPDVPTALIGDPLRLGQVLTNLVNNALKFTDRGEVRVVIRKLGDAATGARLSFAVADTGIGISEEQIKRLFKAFSQADTSTSRKYGGTGLGLAISKHLVEMMGGHIDLESRPGGGSTFFFDAVLGVQSEQRVLVDAGQEIVGRRVLVVDDNASAREILQNLLASLKFEVATVASAAAAHAELQGAQEAGRPYHLVLCDWMMPGTDGIDFIRGLVDGQRLAPLPLFMLTTAYDRDELLAAARGLPVAAVLLKPVTASALLDAVLNAHGKASSGLRRKKRHEIDYRAAQAELRGARVLLVEDNPVNQELALEILTRAGIVVEVANNGAEAVVQVMRGHYDGVLMDCQMPVMDGFEATRKIREQAGFDQLPILAMTANAMSGDRERCVAAGMNDHIPKPIDMAQLFMTMRQWIRPAHPAAASAPGAGGAAAEAVVAAAPFTLPVIAGLQMDAALRRLGGDAHLLAHLIERFYDGQADSVVQMRGALAAGRQDEALRLAHTLKGLAGNIGAPAVLERAAELEKDLRSGAGERLPDLLTALDQALVELREAIEAAGLGKTRAPVATAHVSADAATLRQTLQELATLLAESNAAAGKHLPTLAAALGQSGQGAAASQLQQLIDNFEFEAALELVEQLRRELEPD